jgi:hypothetical protein
MPLQAGRRGTRAAPCAGESRREGEGKDWVAPQAAPGKVRDWACVDRSLPKVRALPLRGWRIEHSNRPPPRNATGVTYPWR